MPVFDQSTQVVKFDRFDERLWNDVEFDMEQIQKNRDELFETYNFVPAEFQDIFMSLFQGDPLNYKSNELRPDHLLNEMITNSFQSLTEVRQARVDTVLDEYAAGFMILKMKEQIENLYKQNKELADLMQQIQELLEQLAGLEPGDGQGAGVLQGQIDKLVEEARGKGLGVTFISGEAVESASRDLQEELDLCKTFGLEDGQLKQMSFKERRDLAELLKNGRMRQFAALIGQFKLAAKGARRAKVSDVPDEVAGLEFSADLNMISTGSLIDMCMPELEMKWMADMANNELVTKHMVGPQRLGRGPVLVVMDESGSMSCGAWGGTREMWGKALSLALADICRRNGRDFTYMGFSSQNQHFETRFKKGKIRHEGLVQFTEHFFGGGTYPFNTLTKAMELVDSYPNGKRPDIVFITDGEFGNADPAFWEKWNSMKGRTEANVYGISFDCEPRELSKLADTIIPLNSMLASPDAMAGVLQQIQAA